MIFVPKVGCKFCHYTIAIVLTCSLFGSGCSAKKSDTRKEGPFAARPADGPPFRLPKPSPPSRNGVTQALDRLQPTQVASLMEDYYRRGDFASAACVGFWSLDHGVDCRYNLACYLALSGKQDDAVYFLQEAITSEGVDPVLAEQDPDLASIRKDKRWPRLSAYLKEVQASWSTRQVLRTSLILPSKYVQGQAIPVVIGLHGLGGNEHFVGSSFQEYADKFGVAFVGVNGSQSLGPKAFRWSEERERDHKQLQSALKSLEGRVSIAEGQTVLLGFSQGAETAFEIAASHPELYRGAICLSPGRSSVGQPLAKADLSGQGYVFVAGAGEHQDTLKTTRQGAAWVRGSGAKVELKIYEEVRTHQFPPDFNTQLGPWLKFIGAPLTAG